MKVRRWPPIGELHPLPVPNARWDTISVDFIVELPDAHGYAAVMNVVDSVSKRAHFIPTHTMITAAGAARLFLTMFGSCMDCLGWWFQIKGFSLSKNLLVSSTACWESALQPPQHTIRKQMGRQRGSTRNWNSTSASLSTRDRTIGMTSCLWPSSSTTTTFMLQHVSPPSCWTLNATPGWASNLKNPRSKSVV